MIWVLFGCSAVVVAAFAVIWMEEAAARRQDRKMLAMIARDVVRLPLYETRTLWIEGEPHTLRRPFHGQGKMIITGPYANVSIGGLYHAPRHNRGTLFEDLSLARFEKDSQQ